MTENCNFPLAKRGFVVYNGCCSMSNTHISARGEAGYRSGFRFQRPGVRIPPGGPKKRVSPFGDTLFFRSHCDIRTPAIPQGLHKVLRAETSTSTSSAQNRGSNPCPYPPLSGRGWGKASRNTISLRSETKQTAEGCAFSGVRSRRFAKRTSTARGTRTLESGKMYSHYYINTPFATLVGICVAVRHIFAGFSPQQR